MTEIPEDVVELAAHALANNDSLVSDVWPKLSEYERNQWRSLARAAGEVFVAWEREQCIRAFKNAWDGESEDAEFYADAIRVRSAPEKE